MFNDYTKRYQRMNRPEPLAQSTGLTLLGIGIGYLIVRSTLTLFGI